MKNDIETIRHSLAHVMAQAVNRIYKEVKQGVGPAIDDGFYQDFDIDKKITLKNLSEIESEMKKIISENLEFRKEMISKDEALKLYKNDPYKTELINEMNDQEISVYKSGEYTDLCKGPHVKSTGELKNIAFQLNRLAGAYWRGDEKNKMMQRIYGLAFDNAKELRKHLANLKEAEKRDHRKLGKELGLFVISDNIGKGLPLIAPKGAVIRKEILDYEYELEKEAGFEHVSCPHIARTEMYKKTGHWQHYKDVMYAPFGIDNEEYVLKPMNCPHHYMIYASEPRSHKDLPYRIAEPGTCYRYEKSGELSGLLRVRSLTIDDSHILMTEDQVESEFKACIQMIDKMFKAFQLKDYYVRLSLSDPLDAVKYIADSKTWDKAGKKLEKIIKDNKLKYIKAKGEASFYGPKIDYIVKDSLGREWQMSTLQLDLFMSKRLNLTYKDENGKEKNPVILHRGLTGSIERTLGILIEHFGGAFPLWLSPIQVKIIPVSDKFIKNAQKIEKKLKAENIRCDLDDRTESVGKKIAENIKEKNPYAIVIGEREAKSGKLAVRTRDQKTIEEIEVDKFIEKLKDEIENKK